MTSLGNRRISIYIVLFTLLLTLVGCGGGGDSSSTAATVSVVPKDIFPDPGLTVQVQVGQLALLDGSGSSNSAGHGMNYQWVFTHRPDGSQAALQNANSANPGFVADVRGTYIVKLVVTVAGVSSDAVYASVEALNEFSAPIPRPDHTTNRTIKFDKPCVQCHVGGPGELIGKSAAHIDTSDLCQACHSIMAFTPVAFMDHELVSGACSGCHNGVTAIGKSDQHVVTNAECNECHLTTTSFLILEPDGSYDHAEISNNCARCHNGVLAIGQDDDHMSTLSDCVLCHSTEAFKPATFDHSNYTFDCARSGCHTGPPNAPGQSVVHPNTANMDCVACHSVKTFVIGDSFDHSAVNAATLACQSCHDGDTAVAVVKPAGHVGTTADCGMCHKTSAFVPAFVDHASEAVTGTPADPIRCDSCHNNTNAIGLPVVHMPVTAPEDCGDRCHTPGSFATGVFDHMNSGVLIDANCATCHDDAIALGKPVAHIPTAEDCSVCHKTDRFKGVVFAHAGIDVSNCALCHDGTISLGKDRFHLPTTEDCSVCHGGDYTTFTSGVFHANVQVNDNCSTCHDGVITIGKSDTHIPTDQQCNFCHSVNAFRPSNFVDAVHVNISVGCVDCHNDRFATNSAIVPGKSPNHIASSNLCESCHSLTTFAVVEQVDHQQVFGVCSDCHNGVMAIGKPPGHVPTSGECNDCHTSTSSFFNVDLNGNYNHNNISDGCSRCHNGTLAIGKHGAHVETVSECNACHTTAAFIPASFDHSNYNSDCARSGCHTGALNAAPGQPVGHPDTNALNMDCIYCHNTTAFFMGNVFNHDLISSGQLACLACHDGVDAVALVKPVSHLATSSDCGMCHNTSGFLPAFVDHGSEAVTGTVANPIRCDSCHNNVDAIGLPQPPATHMPVTAPEDCGDRCHTPGSFSAGTYDHIEVGVLLDSNCAACHDEQITVGKPVSHIPTAEDCSVCHTTDSFVGAIFNHSGIDVSNCALCHDGNIAVAKDLNHLPTVDDCSVCHSGDYTTFTTGVFHDNVFVVDGCVSCHNGVVTTGKTPLLHIPAGDDCFVCHEVVAFVPSSFPGNVHINITQGCEGCHNGRFNTSSGPVAAKSTGHLPTGQDCDNCHTTTAFVPSTFNHAGINNDCAACHNGSYVSVGALGAPDTAIHLNAAGTGSDCGVCHNTTLFIPAFVDHNSSLVSAVSCMSCHDGVSATGKSDKLDGPHVATNDDCNVCHTAGGSFKPAVFDHSTLSRNTRCDSCHGVSATGKDAKIDPPHIPTNEDCAECHNTTAFAGARFDHTGITGNCTSCHGDSAIGKPTEHVPTSQDCGVCHVTTGFLPASFSHEGIVDNCSSCHDGIFARGKSVDHVDTTQDCGVCHNTASFIGATYDHTGIVDNCARSGCHGDGATGMDAKTNPAHIPTSLDCSACHTTAGFLGATWVHGNDTAGRCLDCHISGVGATPQPGNGHFDTGASVQCDACHSTVSWAPANAFEHCPGSRTSTCNTSNYPGDHNSTVVCIHCHTNNSAAVDYPFAQYTPYCAACHANDFERESAHNGGTSGTVEQNKNCGDNGCHRVSASDF